MIFQFQIKVAHFNLSNLFDFLKSPLEELQHDLTFLLEPNEPLLKSVSSYHFKAGGKYLRAALCFLSAKACGDLTPKHLQAARVIEYLHNATLLHDDVIDCAQLRRGQETVRCVWNNQTSVVTGNYLFSEALLMLVQLKNLRAVELVTETTLGMVKGELSQLVQPYSVLDFEHYYHVICNKTAKLFGVSACFGSLFSDTSQRWSQQFYDYGLNVGVAFQMVDDLLDYTDQTGKTLGNDLKERKATLPLIDLMKCVSDSERRQLHSILELEKIGHQEVLLVVEMLKRHQVIEQGLETAKKYVEQATESIENLPPSDAKTFLLQAAHFIVDRTF